MSWTKQEIKELERLASNKDLFATEIAKKLGRSPGSVRWKLRKIGISPQQRAPRMGKWNAKHAHLREKVMTYFLTHSFDETCKRFDLTRSELKSLQTAAYRDPELSHLRKDKRRKDAWSFDETLFLLQASGLQPRAWIAKQLKRGSMHAVKEMVSRLNTNTRYLNGLPKRLAEEITGHEIEGFKVKAGPTGPKVDCRPIIVPWVILYSEARRSSRVPAHICDAIGAMAKFQKRIHGTRGIKDTLESIEKIIGKR